MSAREKKPLRQQSLDCSIRTPVRRQVSEDIISKSMLQTGRKLKLAWTVEKYEPEPEQVEIVARKCGQPKPKPTVRQPRSPFEPDQSTVLFSRQQLTERLRTSWQKNSSCSRHNLDIFLNRSVDSNGSDSGESLPKTPDDSESSEDEENSQCLRVMLNHDESPAPTKSPPPISKNASRSESANGSTKLCASARRMNFRNMGRQRSILESPCPTPEPTRITATSPTLRNLNRHKVTDMTSSCASTPEPRKHLPRMMSAPPRSQQPATAKKLVKTPSMETPTPSSTVNRIKSAPPKRKQKSSRRRGAKTIGQDTTDDEGEENHQKTSTSNKKGVRRGVERGEVVTMVSLVSPAATDSDEPTTCIALLPSTPKLPDTPAPTKDEAKPTPVPPIICLRKPPKCVTFRPSVVGSPPKVSQYQTNFALRRTAVLTHQSSLPAQPTPPSSATSNGGNNQIKLGPTNKQRQALQRSTAIVQPPVIRVPPPPYRKRIIENGKHLQAIREDLQKDVVPIISTNCEDPTQVMAKTAVTSNRSQPNPLISTQATTTLSSYNTATTTIAEEPDTAADRSKVDSSGPSFKSPKEKECWDLFRKMSDKGVSVSFETVLRGLLTPTEYRMRKAALLSVC